jgi:hypothetical protein
LTAAPVAPVATAAPVAAQLKSQVAKTTADEAQPRAQVAERADDAELAGCYPMGYAPLAQRAAANEAAGRVALRRVAPPAPAPSAGAAARAAETRDDFAARPARLLRLDTVAAEQGLAVKTVSGDSVIGWWSRLQADSARIELATGARLTVSRQARVECPGVGRP